MTNTIGEEINEMVFLVGGKNGSWFLSIVIIQFNQNRLQQFTWNKEERMHIHLRTSKLSDLPFLQEMLYEAVFWRPNPNKPTFAESLSDPGVNNGLVEWGKREGDTAVIAMVNSNSAGAAWYRFYSDENSIRGYINETIPVIAIAVHEHYRRQGIGRKMIEWLLDDASKNNIHKLSLMVSKDNHAVKLYRNCGFLEYDDIGDSLLMVRETGV